MSVLVVGVSHKTAPVSVLERLAARRRRGRQAGARRRRRPSTCSRPPCWPPATGWRSTPRSTASTAASRRSPGCCASWPTRQPEDVVPHLYVHYDDGAVSHLFHVAAGLDSMVVGEGQILGQAREALRVGQEAGTIGPALNVLFQQALRVGKRVHAETDIDRAAPSLVALALDRAAEHVGPDRGQAGRSWSAPARWPRWPSRPSPASAPPTSSSPAAPRRTRRRLAEQYDGRAVPLDRRCRSALADADVLVSCTGATGVVLPLARRGGRPGRGRAPAGRHRPGAAARRGPGRGRAARRRAVRPGPAGRGGQRRGDGAGDVAAVRGDRRAGDRRLPGRPRARPP